MTPTIRVNDEGTETEYTDFSEFLDDGGTAPGVRILARDQAFLAEGDLADNVRRKPHVVERATEEDVFAARVAIPGWFIENDDELSDEFDVSHPGETVTTTGLVENYSRKAWRVIAKRRVISGGTRWYEYCWTFVPKSVVTVTRVAGIESQEDADAFNSAVHDADKERRKDFEKADWEKKLEMTEA